MSYRTFRRRLSEATAAHDWLEGVSFVLGLGFLLLQYINLFQWKQAATAVWAITFVVAVMDYLSAVVREKVV